VGRPPLPGSAGMPGGGLRPGRKAVGVQAGWPMGAGRAAIRKGRALRRPTRRGAAAFLPWP